MDRFSSEIEGLLKASGWFEGRSVPALVESWGAELETPGGFTLSPAARAVLAEFGGLHVRVEGAGISCARSDFDLNPLLLSLRKIAFSHFAVFKVSNCFLSVKQSEDMYLPQLMKRGRCS